MDINNWIKKERTRVGIYSFVLEILGGAVVIGAVLGAAKALVGG